ncbi:hypothetical protein GCM10010331_70730 [Streptomyces xanthochromogenes]|nr:hypothetical protein GCM10010331_70730 [Streptomyces xanthochromogenes]
MLALAGPHLFAPSARARRTAAARLRRLDGALYAGLADQVRLIPPEPQARLSSRIALVCRATAAAIVGASCGG